MDLNKVIHLQTVFAELYDQDLKLKDKEIYNKQIADFNKELEELNISSKLTPKEIELKLQQLYEVLMKVPKFQEANKPNDMPNKTSLNSEESEKLINEAQLRKEQIKKTQENAKQEVARATKRTQEIIKEQQKIQEQIKRAQGVQEQLKGTVYAKVVVPDSPNLTIQEQRDLETLRDFAKSNEVNRAKLIDDLTKKIELQTSNELKGSFELEKALIARSAAVDIVEKLSKPEKAYETPVQTAILTAISDKKNVVVKSVLQNKDELLETARNGSTILALHARDSEITNRTISKYLLGDKFTEVLYGPNKIQVELSQTRIEGQTTHEVNLANLNQNSIELLQQQNTFLQSVQNLDVAGSKNLFINQANSYIARQVEKLPAGSAIKKAYSSPIMQSLLSRYGLAQSVVWEATGQTAGFLVKVFPNTAGPVLSLAGKVLGKEFVKPVATKVAAQVIGKTVGTAIATTGAEAGAAAGAAVGGGIFSVVTAAIGAFIGWIGGKLIDKLPQIKKWFQDNGPVLIGIASLGGLVIGGPAVGGIVLLGGLATTGTLGTFAIGALNLFGFIGRSVGIAIATPVIVTLVVLPPLVAFIMLVINNSAYVVPPTPIGQDIINIPPGGNMTKCNPDETGKDVTQDLATSIRAGSVQLLPDSAGSRQEGLCITPTMIVLHSSGGYDNDDGNIRTYETLVQRQDVASCQMATDTNDTIFMLSFFENKVENAWCQDNLNAGGIGIELAGEFMADSSNPSNHGLFSKCSPAGSLMFTPEGPHPCEPLEDLAFDAVCKVMQKYGIPWTQVFQHEDSNSPVDKIDPIGNAWVDKFILRLKDNCMVRPNDLG